MWSNERFSSISTTMCWIADRPVPAPSGVVTVTTLAGLTAARRGLVRGGAGRLGDLPVGVVLAEVVEHLGRVRVRAAGHAVEEHLLAARWHGLAEAERQVLRVRELLVDGEGEQ